MRKDVFVDGKLKKNGDAYDVILYLDELLFEFSDELGMSEKKDQKHLKLLSTHYVNKWFPNIKVKTISIMMGSVIVFSTTVDDHVNAADFTMSYLFFGDTNTQISFVDRTQGQVQVVSPSYFDLYPDGSLQLSWQFDETFIEAMHARGMKVVPLLSNHNYRANPLSNY